MSTAFPHLNPLWTELFVEELIRQGSDYFCIAPGSRSSPLVAAVIARQSSKKVQTFVHLDERALAFHALGYARATGKAAVVITTSGTAAANLFPAIVEASIDSVPMIIVTADRPPELLDTQANQTIDQVKLYGSYVRWFVQIPCPNEEVPAEFLLTTAAQAVAASCGSHAGPVHLNFQFREPLIPDADSKAPSQPSPRIESYWKSEKPYITFAQSKTICTEQEIIALASLLNQAQKGLLVVGQLKNEAEQKQVMDFAQSLGWPTFSDTTSGLPHTHPADLLLMSQDHWETLYPDTILRLGGRLTSKRLARFLAQSNAKTQITVQSHPHRQNPDHQPGIYIHTDLISFCEQITSFLKNGLFSKWPEWRETWKRLTLDLDQPLKDYLNSQKELSEPHIAKIISQTLPSDEAVFVASSMPIRDLDIFGQWQRLTTVAANRGASGIDGTLATSLGYAAGLNRPVTLIIGDLALLHDLNSLASLKDSSQPITIIAINNNGGGIFSFLPIAQATSPIEKPHFEKFWATSHKLSFQKAAELFQIPYFSTTNPQELKNIYNETTRIKKSSLIEISTDREKNFKIHKEIETLLKEQTHGKT